MLFNSFGFLALLPVAVLFILVLPVSWRWLGLLVVSIAFYASFGLGNLAFLGGVVCVTIGFGLALARTKSPRPRRLLLGGGLLLIVGSLVALKFFDFFAGELEGVLANLSEPERSITLPRLGVTAPVGYSFYAFMAASYLIDVYSGKFSTTGKIGQIALYVVWFPKILAGPIERATSLLPQLAGQLKVDRAAFVTGMQLIVWGLFKKVVIADNLSLLVDRTFDIAAYAVPLELLISVYFFAFQIYCDFSGYTDIAIGVSLLFGIKLMENFRRPYLSRTAGEFWSERWHISLGQWFRDYLFIPLGGSRVGELRVYANIMFVFVVSGLWHAGLGYGVGWTFLIWGLLNGLYLWAERATRPLQTLASKHMPRLTGSRVFRIMQIVFTFHLILVSWVFFRADSIGQAKLILQKIILFLPDLPSLVLRYPFTSEHAFGAGLIALLLLVEIFDERRSIWVRLAEAPVALRWAAYYALIFSLLLLGRWQGEQFIYMQF